MHGKPSGQKFQSRFKEEFKPTKFLGNGDYGSVFAAEKIKDKTMKCAVKQIRLNRRYKDNALKEVDDLLKLKHDRIVSMQEAWIETPPPGWQEHADEMLFSTLGITEYLKLKYNNDCSFLYIQMELCQFFLEEWLSRNEAREMCRIKRWFEQNVSAIAFIHERGNVLRDLKPSNILLDGSGGVKVCDFGIIADSVISNESVEEEDDVVTSQTVLNGTKRKSTNQQTSVSKKARKDIGLEKGNKESSQGNSASTRTLSRRNKVYLAPEQMNSSTDYTVKVDMFALGLILAELCVVMTDDEAAEVFDNYRAGKPNHVAELVHLPDVKDLVDWLTNVDPSERPTCEELV